MNTNMYTYQIGDEIAFNTSRNYYWPKVSKVTDVLATRVKTDCGRVFSLKTGKELGKEYSAAELIDVRWAKEHLAANERAKVARERIQPTVRLLLQELGRIDRFEQSSRLWEKVTDEQFAAMQTLHAFLAKEESSE